LRNTSGDSPMTDAEIAVYKRNPETFFGVVQNVGQRANSAAELAEFFFATYKDTPVPLDWNGTFLKLPETDVNLIFLDRGCLDKDTNSNEAIAVSRITQNDQIGLLEPG